jgi:hypothetical protein
MAGKIIADTIETGAGADISTSYLVNGTTKAWCSHDSGTTVDDSHNLSSLSDDGTGLYTMNLTTSMGNAVYIVLNCGAPHSSSPARSGNNFGLQSGNGSVDNRATGSVPVASLTMSSGSADATLQDRNHIMHGIQGDLA